MKRYASFFEWPDRSRAELGIVEELIKTLAQRGERLFNSPTSQVQDPPDCVCYNELNQKVAVEVTEVVCSEAIHLNAKGHDVFRNWQPGELSTHIARQLKAKDQKTYHNGPYAELIVCLFTDEPLLTIDRVITELKESTFGPFKAITSAYMLISYDPSTKSYPVHTLSITHDA